MGASSVFSPIYLSCAPLLHSIGLKVTLMSIGKSNRSDIFTAPVLQQFHALLLFTAFLHRNRNKSRIEIMYSEVGLFNICDFQVLIVTVTKKLKFLSIGRSDAYRP